MGGVSLALRVLAIATVGAVFALTTDSTKLVDSLVQQARVPERFAYGTLAAYQAIPRFAEDLATLRQARRIRGLSGGWHPRLLVSLLVLAIRHGDRKALAMDARAFGSVPRSAYRVVVGPVRGGSRSPACSSLGGAGDRSIDASRVSARVRQRTNRPARRRPAAFPPIGWQRRTARSGVRSCGDASTFVQRFVRQRRTPRPSACCYGTRDQAAVADQRLR